jgi:cell division protein FtsB
MNVDLGIWGKLTRLLMLLFALAILMVVAATYFPLLKQNERMRAVVYQLDTRIQQEESQQRQLRAAMEAMTKDRATIERLTREKLGYAKPGETVIRFEEPAPGAAR